MARRDFRRAIATKRLSDREVIDKIGPNLVGPQAVNAALNFTAAGKTIETLQVRPPNVILD